ncbi:hypothetical protein PGT21_011721 [Puccinia graminis f. sp. tritici]|uniref:Uncharacterized protein n=1 Tax=Puccinia graminis f. sp. tritici TaxID=56615 RepID=A0A5B0MEQ7_PUCGR|nr:hypothetical protein PGT21_011721 [Puccinia graminis f. sp. tritici]
MSVRGLLDRKDVRAPTDEERNNQLVPARFPKDAYNSNYLLEQGEFQADYITTKSMDIENLGMEMVRKSFGTGRCSLADNGSSDPTGPPPPGTHATTQQPLATATGNMVGPSGSEVQMSE